MAKGQQKSNREVKKPKASKVKIAPSASVMPSKADRPQPGKAQGK